jgi:cell wall-associated NlpC family hydrolase
MKKNCLRTLLVSSALTALLCVTALAANVGGGTVTASALNMRSEPNTNCSITTVAPRGSSLILKEKVSDGWYKVWYKGFEGYMSADYIAVSETLDSEFGTGTIQGTTVRMRDGASLSSNTLGYYNTGTQMKILGVSGMWYKVSYNGQTGYVSSDYMTISTGSSNNSTTNSNTTPSTDASTIGEQVVATAKKYLGVPYVWAGTSPSGFDCSGFVYYVYRELGYSINRTAASIYYNGTAVDRSALQPGDVICFTNSGYSYIGHVGIYIGNGQFIHASSGSGQVVISDLSSSYYDSHYYGARRIVS